MLGPTRPFATGAAAALRGFRRAIGSSALRRLYWRMVLAMLALTVALDVAGIFFVLQWTSLDEARPLWWAVGLVLARIAGIVIVLLAGPVASLFLARIAFPFLGEQLFLAALREIDPQRADELSARAGLPLARSVLYNVIRLALFVPSSLVALAVTFVPVVGFVAGPSLQVYLTSRALGWELLDPYLDKLGKAFGQQRAFVRHHRALLVGFALPYTFVLAIPIVGAFAFGVAQAAAATLVAEGLTTSAGGE